MQMDSNTQMSPDFDFAALLEESLAESEIHRGESIDGAILAVDHFGLIVDVGWKQDGIVSRDDLNKMGAEPEDYEVGSSIRVTVIRLEDSNGNLILSASVAKQDVDWERAHELFESQDVANGEVAVANKGGVIIPFGNLRGFIPASHVVEVPRGLNEDDRLELLEQLVGTKINYKVIEVDRQRRRLVFSQRNAERENRNARKATLLKELNEGDVVEGTVSGLCDFGAFVDLGGADGLIHISELAWHRVHHPSEIVNPGDTVEVHVLHLDESGKRIGLSLKRLQENPWAVVDEKYHIGQLVEGQISRVEPFGAFVSLDQGIEALLHVSQISDDPAADPRRTLHEGDLIVTRIISIEAEKQRLGLSLKEVTQEELEQWQEQQAETVAEIEEVSDVEDQVEIEEEPVSVAE